MDLDTVTPLSPAVVSDWFHATATDSERILTPLAVAHLTYYAHARHIHATGQPLVNARIGAELDETIIIHGATSTAAQDSTPEGVQLASLEYAWDTFGDYIDTEHVCVAHNSSAWTRCAYSASPDRALTPELIAAHPEPAALTPMIRGILHRQVSP